MAFKLQKSNMGRANANDLAQKSKDELLKQLQELKQEFATLRVQMAAGGSATKISKFRETRKAIRRVETVININQRLALKKHFLNSRWIPLDLRTKKPRAMRLRLTKRQKNLKTKKMQRKARSSCPLRYAVKAK